MSARPDYPDATPHPEDAEHDAELLAGEPGAAEDDGAQGEGYGPLPGDETDQPT